MRRAGRPPSEAELEALIEQRVEEELLHQLVRLRPARPLDLQHGEPKAAQLVRVQDDPGAEVLQVPSGLAADQTL